MDVNGEFGGETDNFEGINKCCLHNFVQLFYDAFQPIRFPLQSFFSNLFSVLFAVEGGVISIFSTESMLCLFEREISCTKLCNYFYSLRNARN